MVVDLGEAEILERQMLDRSKRRVGIELAARDRRAAQDVGAGDPGVIAPARGPRSDRGRPSASDNVAAPSASTHPHPTPTPRRARTRRCR